MFAVAAAGLLLLAGCGSPPAPQTPAAPQNTAPPQQTSAASDAEWSTVDPCALVPADEIKTYLGPSAAAAGTKSEKFGRPLCTWTGQDRDKVTLQVWQPPAKDVIASPSKKTLPVGAKTGYITSSTAASCLLEVDGGTAFVSMDADAFSQTPSSAAADTTCKKVATTLTAVVGKLGW
jgi:hypothetical protein